MLPDQLFVQAGPQSNPQPMALQAWGNFCKKLT
jgi:hypothetical protein